MDDLEHLAGEAIVSLCRRLPVTAGDHVHRLAGQFAAQAFRRVGLDAVKVAGVAPAQVLGSPAIAELAAKGAPDVGMGAVLVKESAVRVLADVEHPLGLVFLVGWPRRYSGCSERSAHRRGITSKECSTAV